MSEQGRLFDNQGNPLFGNSTVVGVEWLRSGWPSILRNERDAQFAVNLWQILQRSPLWGRVSKRLEETVLWAVTLRLSYGGFLEICIGEPDDRSVLMWLEDFQVPWSQMASYLGVQNFEEEGLTDELEEAVWKAVFERAEEVKVQLERALPTEWDIIRFYCDPYGFKDYVEGCEILDEERYKEEMPLEVESYGAHSRLRALTESLFIWQAREETEEDW